jgi:2-octaprenylphenol hydroxylase
VPLAQRHAVDYVQANVALIGDAAHAIHPLAGQGVNLGLKDVAALTAVVAAALEVEGGAALLGESALLRRYQRRRQPDNLATMAAMEGLKRLFGSRSPLLRVLRNSGLNLFDNQAQLKRWVVAAANGGVA